LCIFKGQNILDSWFNQADHDETAYAASKRGWMESEIFYNWFVKVFLPNIPKARPVLLVFDGHATHITSVRTK
jgi:hypothetical protein